MNYQIRKADISDIDNNLLNIFIQGYNLHYTNRADKFSKRTDENLKEILIASLNSENMLVIENNNRIIGYTSYQFKEKNKSKSLWIDELAIDDNYQGNGYGKIIINELEKICKKENCSSIELCCWEFNKKAQEIYQHLNYQIQRTIFEKKVDNE